VVKENTCRLCKEKRESGGQPLVSFCPGAQIVAEDLQREVTTLLDQIRAGSADAQERLVELVYQELRRLAGGLLRRERAGHTLQPTALVHEALLRLLRPDALGGAYNRSQFLAAAARAMRRVLVDHARQRAADKRGGGRAPLPLDEALDYFAEQHLDLLAVHDALDRLAGLHARQAQVVELRFFGGCTVEEIAAQLQVSVSTVESDFRKAAAFLRSQLVEEGGDDSGALPTPL
jgi:RNA polymerase sigma factor (TIGR02999 family)